MLTRNVVTRVAAAAEGLELIQGPAPRSSSEIELAEALHCWRAMLSALRDDRRKQRAPSFVVAASAITSASATTEHAEHIGAERAAAEAAEEQPLTADETLISDHQGSSVVISGNQQLLTADETLLANGLRRSADGRVWSALGTQLCAKDGCTKPAWHSGICVSVLGYRRRSSKMRLHARHIGPERAAAEAAEARVAAPQPT